jgi:hypothetical protein
MAKKTDKAATPIPEADGEVRPIDVLPNYGGYEEVEKSEAVPAGFETVDDFLEDLRENHRLNIDADRINREEALDDKKFMAGEQWDPAVLAQRQGLPCLVINQIPQFVAQLTGDWRENRRGIKVLPNEDSNVDLAEIRGDLIRSVETRSRAWETYNQSFEEMVTCGDGAFRVCVEYARDDVFDQDIAIAPIDDSLAVVWDRFSSEITGRDARHVFVDCSVPKKEFKRKYPDAEPSSLGRQLRDTLTQEGWIDTDSVKVTEYWRLIEREQLLALFEDGSTRFIDGDIADLIERHGKPVKTRKAPITYAEMYLTTGFKILEGPYSYRLDRLPIIRMTGRTVNINDRRLRYGIVRFMKDPARLKNFWRSVAAEQLGYAPKAQWIAPESAVEGREEQFRQAHLSRDPLIVYNDDATAPPERLEPPPLQAALLNEAQINTQDMKDVTGIHDASLGIKSNETSGRAIMARQQEGDVASLTYYDNANAAVREGGDVINQLISQVYDGTRIIRTVGEDEAIKFLKVNDPSDPASPDLSIGWFDTVLTTGAAYTTRRLAAAQSMMEAIQVWPQLIQVAGDIVAKAQDWPGAEELAERLKKTIPPQFLDAEEGGNAAPAVDPQQQQQFMMEFQALKQENDGLKADRSIEATRAQTEAYNAHTQRLRAVAEMEKAHHGLQQAGTKMVLDHTLSLKDQELQARMQEEQAKTQQTMARNRQQGRASPSD